MKNYIYIIFIFLLPIKLKSQDINTTKGVEIVSKFVDIIMKTNGVEIDFLLKLTEEKINDSMIGVLKLKNKKYILKMSGQEIFYNGISQWVYFKDNEEVEYHKKPSEDDNTNPFSVLLSHKENFKHQFIESKIINKINYNIVEIYPKVPKDKSFFKIELFFDANNNFLNKGIIYEKNGQKMTYKVKDFKFKSLSDNIFTFKKEDYPNVEVIEY